MLWLRVISALIGIPVWIFIIYQGGIWLAFFISVLVIIGTYEFKEMLRVKGFKSFLSPIILGELLLVWGAWAQSPYWLELGIGLSFLCVLFLALIKYPQFKVADIALNFFMLIYVGWSLTYIILLRNTTDGFWFVIYLFIVIWSTDTGAYFSGRFFGKTKLAPLISPKKTVEGAIGGLLFSLMAALIYNWVFQIFALPVLLAATLLISCLGQIGDLVESSFKRLAGVKDSGQIIPGHGGILDRFDSTILTAPVLFYLIIFFS